MAKDAITGLKPFAEERYRNMPLVDIATYALCRLEQLQEQLSIENICVALHRLFPKKFSLVGYPEHPDGMRANRTLLQMQPKYRNYATGTPTKGYALTALGRRTAETIAAKLLAPIRETKPVTAQCTSDATIDQDSRRTLTDAGIVSEVRSTQIFRMYQAKQLDEARGVDFLAMLDAFGHTTKELLRSRFRSKNEAAKNISDSEVVAFLEECQVKFKSLLEG